MPGGRHWFAGIFFARSFVQTGPPGSSIGVEFSS
jgi:hypothetical protein